MEFRDGKDGQMDDSEEKITSRGCRPCSAVTFFSFSSYLVDVQGLHGVFDQLNVDLSLLWLQLLVRNKLSLCKRKEST